MFPQGGERDSRNVIFKQERRKRRNRLKTITTEHFPGQRMSPLLIIRTRALVAAYDHSHAGYRQTRWVIIKRYT